MVIKTEKPDSGSWVDGNQVFVTLFAYDARGLVLSAGDDDTLVTRSYDSLSRLTSETTYLTPTVDVGSARTVGYAYDLAGNVTQIAYPGGRTVTRSFDDLNRIGAITSNQGGGDGGVARQASELWPTPVVAKARRGSTMSSGSSTCDAADRLVESDTKRPDQADNSTSWRQTAYVLDGVHNRIAVGVSTGGASDAGAQIGSYPRSSGTPRYDAEVNQYTETPLDLAYYDANGNLVGLVPPATAVVIMNLSHEQEGISVELREAAEAAATGGQSPFDLARNDTLDEDDLDLLWELLAETWSPIVRLAETKYDYRNQVQTCCGYMSSNVWGPYIDEIVAQTFDQDAMPRTRITWWTLRS